MEDASNRKKVSVPSLTLEQKTRQQELESLQLSRTRVLHDLTGTLHPRHRESLEAALKFLEDKIKLLS